MAHAQDTSHTKRIWFVFFLLLAITVVEVAVGIIKPAFMTGSAVFGLKIINWFFIILTLVKAYYIVYAFMHMENENTFFRKLLIYTAVFYVSYIMFIFLLEGGYIHDMFLSSDKYYNISKDF